MPVQLEERCRERRCFHGNRRIQTWWRWPRLGAARQRPAHADIGGERHTGNERARVGQVQIGNESVSKSPPVNGIVLIEQIANKAEHFDVIGDLV